MPNLNPPRAVSRWRDATLPRCAWRRPRPRGAAPREEVAPRGDEAVGGSGSVDVELVGSPRAGAPRSDGRARLRRSTGALPPRPPQVAPRGTSGAQVRDLERRRAIDRTRSGA